jgi:hypothetical protein
VAEIIEFHFDPTDEEVYFDPYIKAFLEDWQYAMELLPAVQDWKQTQTRDNAHEDLVQLLTSIIWQASVGHTVENNPIWEYGANPTIAPWELDKELPNRKPEVRNRREYEEYLPRRDDFSEQLKLMYALTDTTGMDDTEDLTDFNHLWVDPSVLDVVNKFKSDVADLEDVIIEEHDRKNYPIPYDFILPTIAKSRIDI